MTMTMRGSEDGCIKIIGIERLFLSESSFLRALVWSARVMSHSVASVS